MNRFDFELWQTLTPTRHDSKRLWALHLSMWRTNPWYVAPLRTATGWTSVADLVVSLMFRSFAIGKGVETTSAALSRELSGLCDEAMGTPGKGPPDETLERRLRDATAKLAWYMRTERSIDLVETEDREPFVATRRPCDDAGLVENADDAELLYEWKADDFDFVHVSRSFVFDAVTLLTETALVLRDCKTTFAKLRREPRRPFVRLRREMYDRITESALQNAFSGHYEAYEYCRRVTPADKRIYLRHCPEAKPALDANVMCMRHLDVTKRRFDFGCFADPDHAEMAADAGLKTLWARGVEDIVVPRSFVVTKTTGPRIVFFANMACVVDGGAEIVGCDSLCGALRELRVMMGERKTIRAFDAASGPYGREVDVSVWDAFLELL